MNRLVLHPLQDSAERDEHAGPGTVVGSSSHEIREKSGLRGMDQLPVARTIFVLARGLQASGGFDGQGESMSSG